MTGDSGDAPRRRWRAWAVPAIPAVLATGLALWTSARTAIWRDEYATAMYASLSPADSVAATSHLDAVIEPYYLLIHALSPVIGTGAGMRWVSIASFVGMVAIVAVIARRWWGDLAGAVAGVALALSTVALSAAALARPYALSMLFVTIAVLAVDVAVRRSSIWWWAGYAGAAVAAVTLQPLASLSIAVTGLLVIGRRAMARWALASLPAGLATIGLLLLGSSQSAQLSWLTPVTVRTAIQNLALALGLSSQRQVVWDGMLVLVFVAAIALALAALRGRDRRRLWFASALAFLPPVALFAVSIAATPVLSGRYLSFSAIGASLSLAGVTAAARAAKRRTPAIVAAGIGATLLVVVVILSAARLVGPPSTGENLPVLAARVAESARAGDLLVLTQRYEQGGLVYGFAIATGDVGLRDEIVTGIPDGPRPVLDVREIVSTTPLRTVPVSPRDAANPGRHLWLVTIWPPEAADPLAVDRHAAVCINALNRDEYERFGDVRLYRTPCPASG